MLFGPLLLALLSVISSTPEAVRSELAHFLQPGETFHIDSLSGTVLFDNVIAVLHRSSPPIRHYLEQCDSLVWQELPFAQPIPIPQIPLNVHVGSSKTNYLFGVLRFYLVQRLIQARLFDEAREIMHGLTPENCIDPAGLRIMQAIVFYYFSDQESCLDALEQFQEFTERQIALGEKGPRRYAELAKLLRYELNKKPAEDDTGKISGQMDNVRRRLGKGRTDKETQQTEKNVLDSLEQLIEKIEKQAERQDLPGDGGQSGNPAEDSFRMQQKGQGNVERRELLPGEHWGNWPAKEREETLLKIEKDFPPYYRDLIEQYFREMAK